MAVGKELLKGSCCCMLRSPAGECAGQPGASGVSAEWVGEPSWDNTSLSILIKWNTELENIGEIVS